MPFSSGEPSVSLYSSFRSCWDMLSRLDRWNSCAGMSIPAMMKSRSEEHTSELQSLMRISYAVFCLKKKTKRKPNYRKINTQPHKYTNVTTLQHGQHKIRTL